MNKHAYQLGQKLALLDLGPGEFTMGDKLQPYDYIKARTETLRKLHKQDPQLSSELLSLVYPNKLGRPWTSEELEQRLSLPTGVPAAAKQAAFDIAYKVAPSLASAYDAFQASRQMQSQMQAQENAMRFPALHSTQPMMHAMQMGYSMDPSGSMGFSSPVQEPVHHRRHRHHAG